MKKQWTAWRAAVTTALLVLTATVGSAQPARADTVVTQSQHSRVEMSTTAAQPGGTVTFTLTITNSNDNMASGRIILEPSTPIFTAVDGNCVVMSGPQPEQCEVYPAPDDGRILATYAYIVGPFIPANTTAKVSLTTTVRNDAAPGTYTITPRGEVREVNQSAVPSVFTPGSFTFTVLGQDADIAVGLSATPAPLLSGAITYTQTVHNNGPATVASGTITTILPTQTTGVTGAPANCSYNNNAKTVACTITNLADGTTVTNAFTARLNLLTLGSLPATATRTTSNPTDSDSTNDTATANCTAVTSLIIVC